MRKVQCKLRKIRRISVESLPRGDDVALFGVGKAPPTRNPGHGERLLGSVPDGGQPPRTHLPGAGCDFRRRDVL